MYKKSHNDYWTSPQVLKAVQNGCNTFEADLILLRGAVMCRHSWRPLKQWCHGSFEQYLNKMIAYVKYPSILQIEIKDPDPVIIGKVTRILESYAPRFQHPITFAMYGGDDFNKDKVAKAIYNNLKDQISIVIWNDWKKDKQIQTVDLFSKPKWWWY